MPPSRTSKSNAAKNTADAAVYEPRPGIKTGPSAHSGAAGAGRIVRSGAANAPTGQETTAPHASANEQRPKKTFSLFSNDYNQALSEWGHGLMGPDPLRAMREFSKRQTELSHAAAVAPKSPQQATHTTDLDSFRIESPIPMQTERQSDEGNTSRTAAQDTEAEGCYSARFGDKRHWKKNRHQRLGHTTREIEFNDNLTPEHVDYLLALPKVCQRLTAFSFVYHDVDYDSTNSCKDLTDGDVIRIARACPNLKTFSLPGASGLTEKSILGMCEHCPELTSLHISEGINGRATGQDEVFRALTEHPELAPNLKVLRMADNTKNKKALRVLSKARPKLGIALVTVNQEKEWGSWYLVKDESKWLEGKSSCWGDEELAGEV